MAKSFNQVSSHIALYIDNFKNLDNRIYAKQYDKNTRFIIAWIRNKLGSVKVTGSVSLCAEVANGLFTYEVGDVLECRALKIPIHCDILKYSGDVNCYIQVHKDGELSFTTPNFTIEVEAVKRNE